MYGFPALQIRQSCALCCWGMKGLSCKPLHTQILAQILVIPLIWVKFCLRILPLDALHSCWISKRDEGMQEGSRSEQNLEMASRAFLEQVSHCGNELQGNYLWGSDPEQIHKPAFYQNTAPCWTPLHGAHSLLTPHYHRGSNLGTIYTGRMCGHLIGTLQYLEGA